MQIPFSPSCGSTHSSVVGWGRPCLGLVQNLTSLLDGLSIGVGNGIPPCIIITLVLGSHVGSKGCPIDIGKQDCLGYVVQPPVFSQ